MYAGIAKCRISITATGTTSFDGELTFGISGLTDNFTVDSDATK